MPRRPDPLAVGSAKRLISSLRIMQPSEIDVELIANHLGILVKRRSLRHEEGRLLRAGSHGVIVVAEHAFRTSKWRFVVAHELGHFIRHPDADNFGVCTDGNLADYVGSGRETEANDFAAELLMPESLFKKQCDRNRPSLHDVSELAKAFSTSLTSTALRFVYFAPEPCAVVHSTNGVIDWCDWSQDFRLGIKKGSNLTTRTYAGDLFAGSRVDDRLQQVDADAWSGNPWASDFDLYEHSCRVGQDSVLTFLWHPFK